MKISMEVGVKTPQDPKKWSMVPHVMFFFFEDPGFSESKIFFGQAQYGTPWDPGALGPWDRASWDPRDTGTLGHWDPRDPGTGLPGTPGTLGPGLLGPQGHWDPGTLGPGLLGPGAPGGPWGQ